MRAMITSWLLVWSVTLMPCRTWMCFSRMRRLLKVRLPSVQNLWGAGGRGSAHPLPPSDITLMPPPPSRTPRGPPCPTPPRRAEPPQAVPARVDAFDPFVVDADVSAQAGSGAEGALAQVAWELLHRLRETQRWGYCTALPSPPVAPRPLTFPWSFFMWDTYSSRSGNHEWQTPQVQPLPLDLLVALRWKRLRLALRSSGELGGSSSSVEDEDSSEILGTGVSMGSCFGVSSTAAFLTGSSRGFAG